MRRSAFALAVICVFFSIPSSKAQEAPAPALLSAPAASSSQSYCGGFIAESEVPHDISVLGGADNDFHSRVRQFINGESIYIAKREGGDLVLGSRYSVVRPANDLFSTTRYQGEAGEIG